MWSSVTRDSIPTEVLDMFESLRPRLTHNVPRAWSFLNVNHCVQRGAIVVGEPSSCVGFWIAPEIEGQDPIVQFVAYYNGRS